MNVQHLSLFGKIVCLPCGGDECVKRTVAIKFTVKVSWESTGLDWLFDFDFELAFRDRTTPENSLD